MTTWKTKVVLHALPFKIVSTIIGAVSYCWHISLSRWLLFERPRMVAFNWNLFLDFPAPVVAIGGLMGYISAAVLIAWCQQYYRTARFICFVASSWFIGLGVAFICFVLFGSSGSLLERLTGIVELLFVIGTPFCWGLILQQCERRLRRLTNKRHFNP